MACEIENTVTRPNGPFGDAVTNGRCLAHSFRTYGVAMNGKLCPIGQIEDATAKALATIAGTATAGQNVAGVGGLSLYSGQEALSVPSDTRASAATFDAASTDPHHGGKIMDATPGPVLVMAPPKRPRKTKPTEE